MSLSFIRNVRIILSTGFVVLALACAALLPEDSRRASHAALEPSGAPVDLGPLVIRIGHVQLHGERAADIALSDPACLDRLRKDDEAAEVVGIDGHDALDGQGGLELAGGIAPSEGSTKAPSMPSTSNSSRSAPLSFRTTTGAGVERPRAARPVASMPPPSNACASRIRVFQARAEGRNGSRLVTGRKELLIDRIRLCYKKCRTF